MAKRAQQQQPASALGIDIGSHGAKYLEVEKHVGKIAIKAIGGIAVNPGTVVDGVVRNPKLFGKLIANELNRSAVSADAIVFSVPSRLAVLRWVSLPVLPEHELRSAARLKVQRHLPFSTSSAYIQACASGHADDNGNVDYLVIAVKREVIDSRAEALEAAGLAPTRAELEAQALLRVVEHRMREKSPLWRDASLTIIDVGGESTHMYVVQKQRLQFMRGVRFGSCLFTTAIQNELEIDPDDAERLLASPNTQLTQEGVLRMIWNDQPICVGIRSELDKLTREFLRLLRYFRSLHPERSYAGILDHMLLCGGVAALQGFPEYLQSSLGLRVEAANPLAGMIGNFTKESFQSISTHQEAYSVVMGLALGGFKTTTTGGGHEHDRDEFVWLRPAA